MLFAHRGGPLERACVAGILGAALFAVLTAAIVRLTVFGTAGPFSDPVDFRAFYCAGAALDARGDPYRVEPDRSCQRNVLAGAGLGTDRHVLPAPLPPYALLAFAALARFPYGLAAAMWLAANTLAVGLAIFLVGELAGIRPAFAAPAMLFAAGVVPLLVGQLVPLVLAAALAAALAGRRGNGTAAAAGALVAALEPHLALPVWLGLWCCAPAARRPLMCAGAAIIALSAAAGPALNLEYIRDVLPQHARSEVLNFGEQYALSPLLAGLGVPYGAALRAGSACYAVMLGAGCTLGAALRRRTGDAAFGVTAPLACVVLGGPFLHVHQTAAALPLGLMLLGRLPRRSAAFAGALIAVVCIAVPWQFVREVLPAQPLSVRDRTAISVALSHAGSPDESIELPYTAYVDTAAPRVYRRSFTELLIWKLPTWAGLGLLLGCAVAAAGPYRPRALTGTELVEPNMRSPASPSPGTI